MDSYKCYLKQHTFPIFIRCIRIFFWCISKWKCRENKGSFVWVFCIAIFSFLCHFPCRVSCSKFCVRETIWLYAFSLYWAQHQTRKTARNTTWNTWKVWEHIEKNIFYVWMKIGKCKVDGYHKIMQQFLLKDREHGFRFFLRSNHVLCFLLVWTYFRPNSAGRYFRIIFGVTENMQYSRRVDVCKNIKCNLRAYFRI